MFKMQSRAMWALALAVGLGMAASASVAKDPPDPSRPIEAPGKLVPAEVTLVYPQVEGVIREVRCKNGEAVKKGQILVEIDNTELTLRRATRRQEFDVAQKRLNEIQARAKDAPTLEDRRQLEAAAAEQRLQLDLRARELDEVERLLEGAMVKAPADGTVLFADGDALQGKYLRRGEPLLRIARLDGDWQVQARVAEADVGRLVALLDRAEGKEVPVELEVAAFPGRTFRGTLRQADVARQMTVHEEKAVLAVVVRVSAGSAKELRALPVGVNARVRVAPDEKK